MAAHHLHHRGLKFQTLIGTGGIGSGMFFALEGNHTLGREESRAGVFLDRRDYCKLHIIAHYIQVLLGPGLHSFLIGKVGDDRPGQQVLEEIRAAGMDDRYVQRLAGEQTLYSVCFLYPDGSGGNLTTADSACSRVTAADILRAEAEFEQSAGRGIALAAPEVPLEARRALLELATRFSFYRAGSFVSGEIRQALEMGLFAMLDLLSINLDEAAQLLGVSPEESPPADLAQRAIERLPRDYPKLRLALTAGKSGSWTWDGSQVRFQPAFPARAASTAGAGDAFLAALIAGEAIGLDLARSQELAGLVAALSVTSPHTIAPEVSRQGLSEFARSSGLKLSPELVELLQPS